MTPVQSVRVEVNLQDYFFAESDDLAIAPEVLDPTQPHPPAIASPIPNTTWSSWFQTWIEHLNPEISPVSLYELSLRLTNDAEIHTLNQHYRNQDKPTDVLAFAALEVDCPPLADLHASDPVYLGDVVISVDTARLQAQENGHSLEKELAWLATHGLLHLLGWDHPDDESLHEMLHQQAALLQTVGLDVQYAG
jgi:probable rRNA maturation factor